MKLLVGLVLAVVCVPIALWGFSKAVSGQDFFNWIWVIAGFISIFGLALIFARIRNWMNS